MTMLRFAVTSALVLGSIWTVNQLWPIDTLQTLPKPEDLLSTVKQALDKGAGSVAADIKSNLTSDIGKRIALGTVLGVGLSEMILS